MKNLGTETKHLQEVIKIYLMATGGSTEHLGIISCSLIDVLSDLCDNPEGRITLCSVASGKINRVSVEIIKIICLSVIERLSAIFADGGLNHPPRISLDESEVELLPYLVFLKSSFNDLSSVTKFSEISGWSTGYMLLSQKVQELIDDIES